MSLVIYGHEHGRQMVGTTMRNHGHANSAHRILKADGTVSRDWRGVGGGPEEAIRRLRRDGIWDEAHSRARDDRFIGAEGLRRLEE